MILLKVAIQIYVLHTTLQMVLFTVKIPMLLSDNFGFSQMP